MRASLTGIDNAGGGALIGGQQNFVRCDGSLVALLGDRVSFHGDAPYDNAIVTTASSFVRIRGVPIARAGSLASCGDVLTGSATLDVGA